MVSEKNGQNKKHFSSLTKAVYENDDPIFFQLYKQNLYKFILVNIFLKCFQTECPVSFLHDTLLEIQATSSRSLNDRATKSV